MLLQTKILHGTIMEWIDRTERNCWVTGEQLYGLPGFQGPGNQLSLIFLLECFRIEVSSPLSLMATISDMVLTATSDSHRMTEKRISAE